MTSDNERQGVDEEEHVMWDKNEDYYARKKRGQLGRYATIDRTWDDDHENKRQLYLIKRERAKAWFFSFWVIYVNILCVSIRSGSNWFYVIISIVTTFNCVIYYPCCVHCRLDITSFCWAISLSNRIYRCCCSLNNIVIVPAAECAIVVATAVLWSLSSTKIILFPNTTSQFLRLHLELFYASQHSWYHPFLVIIRALLFNAVVISPCHSTTNSERRKG